MGLPSKKRTSRSRDERRAHYALKQAQTTLCEKCKSPVMPHRACAVCGTYKGKKAVDVEKRIARSSKRTKKVS